MVVDEQLPRELNYTLISFCFKPVFSLYMSLKLDKHNIFNTYILSFILIFLLGFDKQWLPMESLN